MRRDFNGEKFRSIHIGKSILIIFKRGEKLIMEWKLNF